MWLGKILLPKRSVFCVFSACQHCKNAFLAFFLLKQVFVSPLHRRVGTFYCKHITTYDKAFLLNIKKFPELDRRGRFGVYPIMYDLLVHEIQRKLRSLRILHRTSRQVYQKKAFSEWSAMVPRVLCFDQHLLKKAHF